MSNPVEYAFHFLGWFFLPNIATSILQSTYYGITVQAGQRKPQPGEARHELHRRRIRTLVLILYLVYTFIQALYDLRLEPDFYVKLRVSSNATEKDVRTQFRRLAALYHPDKAGPNPDPGSDDAFVQLRLAQETLLAPAKRFAYDRFGPSIVRYTAQSQEKLQTKRDYVYAGLRSLLPEYIQGAVSLVVLNYFWFPKFGQFWRYLVVLAIALLEFTLLTHEWSPSGTVLRVGTTLHDMFPDLLPPHLLPFQILAIVRRMSISINIFISQLAPKDSNLSAANQIRQIDGMMSHLSQAVGRVDQEANNLVKLGLAPYRGERDLVERLRTSMVDGMSLGAVRNSQDVKDAVAKVLDRRNLAPQI